jgi:phage-related baseplate assembly protein
MSKTYAEIVASLKVNIGKKRPNLETTEGTITSDIFEAIGDEIEDVYADIEHLAVLPSFRYYDKMSTDELNDLAYNYGITRKEAIKSSGNVYFRASSAPTQNILIPEGTVVTTEPDERLQKISFITTAERTLYYDNAASYYNSTSGYYEIAVPIQCIDAGETGNVGVGAIKLIEGSIPGADNIYNYSAFTNGSEEEMNENLADRCLLAIQGASVGTESGYIGKMLESAYVYDALVVGPGDPLMTRDNGAGGKIDIYVKIDKDSVDTYTQTSDEFTYAGETDKIPTCQPIKEIVSIVGSVSGALTETTDYKLTKLTGAFQGSIYATDTVEFLGSPLTAGETVTITYTYYDIVTDLQNAVEDVRPIGTDVLVKLAEEVLIDVTAYVYADSTITDKTTLSETVQTAIDTFLTFKDLDGEVQQSDVIEEIVTITGVDKVRIPLDKLAKSGQSGVSDITLQKNEYPSTGTISITMD